MTENVLQTGDDLRAWRQRNGRTQQVLAYELGVTRQSIAAWERPGEKLSRMLRFALTTLESGDTGYKVVTGVDLKQWRESIKCNQEALAYELSVKRQKIVHLERSNSSLPAIVRLAISELQRQGFGQGLVVAGRRSTPSERKQGREAERKHLLKLAGRTP
jgi:DNA-binding XRE family transcriptional regulator